MHFPHSKSFRSAPVVGLRDVEELDGAIAQNSSVDVEKVAGRMERRSSASAAWLVVSRMKAAAQ
jgi:hypothetical protein